LDYGTPTVKGVFMCSNDFLSKFYVVFGEDERAEVCQFGENGFLHNGTKSNPNIAVSAATSIIFS
jgi:hypothetical protein